MSVLAFANRLWRDQVGSSASAEMALVTGVTVAALFMGMSQFSATVNRHFDDVAKNPDMSSLEELDQQDKDEAAARKAEHERNRVRFERAREERRRRLEEQRLNEEAAD